MNILYLDQTAAPGGAEMSLFSEVTALKHKACVMVFEDGPLCQMFAQAGIHVEVVKAQHQVNVSKASALGPALSALPALASLVRQVCLKAAACDIIYANSQKAFVVAALAAAICRRPTVWRLRDILDASHFNTSLRHLAVGLANAHAARVIVNSAATGRAFALAGGDAARVSVAHPGIDDVPFRAVPPAQVDHLRAALNAGAAPLIGLFGRLSPWKGQHLFVEAIARLPNVVGVIVGAALFGEDAYVAALRDSVAALGLAKRIRFLGFRSDIPALMRAMDVIVHCSTAPEPFGRVVVEGMLAGRPVVASAAGGVLEIISHGQTGWLFEQGSVTDLERKLRDILESPEYAAAVAKAGQNFARKTFTVGAGIAKIEEALQLVHPDDSCGLMRKTPL
jgi:glycosyltransferase involved in cell wall biosynthesis